MKLQHNDEIILEIEAPEDPKECLKKLMTFTRTHGFDTEIARKAKELVAEHYDTDDLSIEAPERESNRLQKEIEFANDTDRKKNDQGGSGEDEQ